METSDQTQDLYEILDVPKTADAAEIKRAYRRLAMKYHPDKNQDPQAAEMFKKINHAYDILSNPQKRRIYDAYGEDGLNGTPNGTPMSSLFPGFFGQQRPVYRYKCQITLEQYFRDKQIKLDFPRSIMCENCSGTGFRISRHIFVVIVKEVDLCLPLYNRVIFCSRYKRYVRCVMVKK
jgi:DnaJ-class molecular chaperone